MSRKEVIGVLGVVMGWECRFGLWGVEMVALSFQVTEGGVGEWTQARTKNARNHAKTRKRKIEQAPNQPKIA